MERTPTDLQAAPYVGSSDVATIVRELKAALPNPDEFEILDESEYGATLASKRCAFVISKDRYGEGFGTYVREPDPKAKGMDLYLLRQLRGAYHPEQSTEDMAYYGRLFGEFFPDLLAGDFSIRKLYEDVKDEFNRRFLELRSLPPEHPAVLLCRKYDIRWLKKMGWLGRLFG